MLGTWEDSQRKHYSTNTRLYKTRRSSASAVRNSETATPHTAQQHKRDMLCDTNQAFFFLHPTHWSPQMSFSHVSYTFNWMHPGGA